MRRIAVLALVLFTAVDATAQARRFHRYSVTTTGLQLAQFVYGLRFNNRGEILLQAPGGAQEFVWSPTRGLITLPLSPPITPTPTWPILWLDLNNVGQLVGQEQSAAARSWIYSIDTGQMTQIAGVSGFAASSAYRINDNGDLLFFSNGWRVTSGGVTQLLTLPAGYNNTGFVRLGNDGGVLMGRARASLSSPYESALVYPSGSFVLQTGAFGFNAVDLIPGQQAAIGLAMTTPSNVSAVVRVDAAGTVSPYFVGHASALALGSGDRVAADGSYVSSANGTGPLLVTMDMNADLEQLTESSTFRVDNALAINDGGEILAIGTIGGTSQHLALLRPTTTTMVIEPFGAARALTNGEWEYTLRAGQSCNLTIAGGEAGAIGAIAAVDAAGQILDARFGVLDNKGRMAIGFTVPVGLTGQLLLMGGALDSQYGILVSTVMPLRLLP